MRILVMFDLPVGTAAERREYARFRKHLITNGYLMMQESVYCKLAQNSAMADSLVDNLRKNNVENLWHYIKVMGDLLHIKVFAFVNLKSFLSNEELDLLYKQCFYEQKLLILIESHDSPFRTDEKKCIVDAEGCVIYC